jgi:membrane glycosyltransferase
MDALGSLAKPMQQETTAPTFRSVPDEIATHMPAQDLERWDSSSRVWHDTDRSEARRRRAIVLAATLALTAAAGYEMYQVLNVSRMTALQGRCSLSSPLTFSGLRCHA